MGVKLTTERLALREFAAEDVQAVHRYASDAEVTRYMLWGPNSWAETEAFVREAMVSQQSPSRDDYTIAVVQRGDDQVIGAIHLGILSGPAMKGRGDLGYVLARQAWGHGYATEAGRAVIRWAFLDLGLHRVEATCGVDNAASRRVLEKLGMSYEGSRRDDYWVRGGWRSSHLYGLLAEDDGNRAGKDGWPAGGGVIQ